MTARKSFRLGTILVCAVTLGACRRAQNLTGFGTVVGQATVARSDADMGQVLQALTALGAQPIETPSVQQARATYDASARALAAETGAGAPLPGGA